MLSWIAYDLHAYYTHFTQIFFNCSNTFLQRWTRFNKLETNSLNVIKTIQRCHHIHGHKRKPNSTQNTNLAWHQRHSHKILMTLKVLDLKTRIRMWYIYKINVGRNKILMTLSFCKGNASLWHAYEINMSQTYTW